MIMKHIVNKLFSLLLAASGLLAVCSSCDDDMENYDNKAFVSTSKVGNILLKGTNNEESVKIQTAIAKPL